MKFLLDQGLPRSAVRHLQSLGHEAEHVGDLGMAAAKDEAILAVGETRGAVVVTLAFTPYLHCQTHPHHR